MSKKIERFFVISALAVSCVLYASAPARCQESRVRQKLSDHVYAYVGVENASAQNSFGSNCGFVVGNDAVLVIDPLISARDAEKLYADIRTVTDKPVRYVVNTHFHIDHVGGNGVFVKDGAVVIGHEKSRLAAPGTQYSLTHYSKAGLSAEQMEGTVLCPPTITFDKSMRVDLGGVVVDLDFPGPSHTDGSITAAVHDEKVIFLGDILFTTYHPYLGEGDILSWVSVLAGLERTKATVMVPGHGPLSMVSDLRDMQSYLKTFVFRARLLCLGKGQDDAPALAQEIVQYLPDQGRKEMTALVEQSLRDKYLPGRSSSRIGK